VTGLVANARMYTVSPAVKAAWQKLLAWVAQESGVPLTYIDHAPPAPLDDLWSRPDLGAAFMCGFPFAAAAPQPLLLAAPVPAPPRYQGKPIYCTDFVVRADRPFRRLSETFGGRIGWTVTHSQSGYNAVRHHLLGRANARFEWIGPLVTPRRVIEALLSGAIDVGPLDSYVHDLLERHDPELAAKLHTVESTVMNPIPPVVASAATGVDAAARLRAALLSCHTEPTLAATFETLLLARFAPVDPADYQVLLTQERDADAGRVPAPGRS
jgi:ABC-type phosphate/phosphonate transport system substrate-binding protein